MTKQKKGNLYLIPTAIAENSLHKVITDNLKLVIVNTKYFMVENVRTARRFISSLKLNIRIEHLECGSLGIIGTPIKTQSCRMLRNSVLHY